MDTNQIPFELGCYRLRTARQKKRLQKEDFDKQLLRLHRELDKLKTARRQLPMIALETPYQKGWKRSFVLREDVAKCNKADFYRELLAKINTVQYSHDKSFKRKKRRRRKRIYEVMPQQLRSFREYEWLQNKVQLSDAERLLFYQRESLATDGRTIVKEYCYAEPWRFVLQVTPHMITHVKMVDEVLEQEIDALKRRLNIHHWWPRLNKLRYGSHRWSRFDYKGNPKHINPLKNKSLHQICTEAWETELF